MRIPISALYVCIFALACLSTQARINLAISPKSRLLWLRGGSSAPGISTSFSTKKQTEDGIDSVSGGYFATTERNSLGVSDDLREPCPQQETEAIHTNKVNQTVLPLSTSVEKITSVNPGGEVIDASDPDDYRLMMLIRVLFLCYYGSLGSLMPYLPVYYQSLGHGGLIIGMLGSIKPLTTFFVAPVWGVLSDQSGDNKFNVLKITFMVSLLTQLIVPFRNDVRFLVAMVFVTAIVNAPVKSLIDSFVMDHLSSKDRTQYGKLRLWGLLGFGVGSSGAGFILSKSLAKGGEFTTEGATLRQCSSNAEYLSKNLLHLWDHLRGYKLLFAIHALLAIPTWLCLNEFHRMDEKKTVAVKRRRKVKNAEEEVQEPPHILEGLRALLTSSDAMLFFFLVFVVGLSAGCIDTFAYVRIREVGGSVKQMGICRLVSSMAGAPMFYFSGPLTEKLGADRVLVLSIVSYVLRFFIYAAMKAPYHGLPAEALRGLTFGAFWSTCTVYAHRIAPHGMHATMLIFLNAMYGGLGQSLGALIGGKLQQKFGTVSAFVYSGIFDLCFVGLVVTYLSCRSTGFRNPQALQVESKIKKS
jgi:MFS-type transporter involved in bile tolerance (Atg22 family)